VTQLAGNVLAETKRFFVSGSTVAATDENNETPRSSGGDMQEFARQGNKTEAVADAIASDELLSRFRHFDLVLSPPDHHYLDSVEQVRDLLTTSSSVLF
jgi:hypothetical protein